MRENVRSQATMPAPAPDRGAKALPWPVRLILWMAGPTPTAPPARRVGWLHMAGMTVIGLAVIGAWVGGRRSAPVTIRRMVETQQVPIFKAVSDPRVLADLARLKKDIAGLKAERDAAVQRAERAESALAAATSKIEELRRDLAAAYATIQRMNEEQQARTSHISSANGQCPRCGHLLNIRAAMARENLRCPRCGSMFAGRTAMQRRAAEVERLMGRK